MSTSGAPIKASSAWVNVRIVSSTGWLAIVAASELTCAAIAVVGSLSSSANS
jgi:hypothetical protein